LYRQQFELSGENCMRGPFCIDINSNSHEAQCWAHERMCSLYLSKGNSKFLLPNSLISDYFKHYTS